MSEQRQTAEKMIEMGSDLEEEAEADSGSSSKRLLIMVGLFLILLIGGGAGAYFSGLADPILEMLSGDEPEAAGESDAASAEPVDSRNPLGSAIFYDLPEMLVNLGGAGQKRNYLKMNISLELASEGDITTVETMLPRIVDDFQVYLREMRMEDLQGVGGMNRLRQELLNRVNADVSPLRVSDVLFREMIVQ